MLDMPPEGSWTVFVEVTDPGDSSLVLGARLCAIVHSPSLYEGRLWSAEPPACCVALNEDIAVSPLWICGEGVIPMVVVEPHEHASPTAAELEALAVVDAALAASFDAVAGCEAFDGDLLVMLGQGLGEQVEQTMQFGDRRAVGELTGALQEMNARIVAKLDESCPE